MVVQRVTGRVCDAYAKATRGNVGGAFENPIALEN